MLYTKPLALTLFGLTVAALLIFPVQSSFAALINTDEELSVEYDFSGDSVEPPFSGIRIQTIFNEPNGLKSGDRFLFEIFDSEGMKITEDEGDNPFDNEVFDITRTQGLDDSVADVMGTFVIRPLDTAFDLSELELAFSDEPFGTFTEPQTFTSFSSDQITSVPVPGTIMLLGIALLGLGLTSGRRATNL